MCLECHFNTAEQLRELYTKYIRFTSNIRLYVKYLNFGMRGYNMGNQIFNIFILHSNSYQISHFSHYSVKTTSNLHWKGNYAILQCFNMDISILDMSTTGQQNLILDKTFPVKTIKDKITNILNVSRHRHLSINFKIQLNLRKRSRKVMKIQFAQLWYESQRQAPLYQE